MFVRPVPRMSEELLAGQVGFVDALFFQPFDDFGFRGNRRVVGAGNPAGVLALKPCAAHENVLYRLVQHVSHVQYARHVGRRDDDGVRRPAVRLAVKETFVQPVLIPAAFDVCGIVLGVHKSIYTFSYLHISLLAMFVQCAQKSLQRYYKKSTYASAHEEISVFFMQIPFSFLFFRTLCSKM